MGNLDPEKVLEAICQGLDAAKQKALQDSDDITKDLNDAFNENEGDILDKTITFKIKLKVDRAKGLIDVNGANGWTCARGGTFNGGNVLMGELLPGFDEASTGQGQGRGMSTGETPEEQIDNLNQDEA